MVVLLLLWIGFATNRTMRFRLSRTLLVLSGLALTVSHSLASKEEDGAFKENLKSDSKHVLFCVGLGTPSHSVALFEIGRELKRRGHTFSYAGFKTIADWDKDHEFNFFPVGEQSWGGAIKDKGASASLTEGPRGVAHLGAVISQIVPPTYEPQYTDLLRLLNGTTPLPSHVGPFDLLVCDNFAFFCSDLATQLGLPYMVANHGFFFGVGDSPYLLDSLEGDPEVSRSFALRFKNKVLLPLVARRAFAPLGKALAETRSRVAPWLPVLSDPNPYSRWQGVPILNTGSFFGWDEARELSPLVHMVGPIVTHRVRHPPPLDDAFQAVFDSSNGKPVVLVAMGSFAALSGTRAEKLLHAFQRLREDGVIGAAIISSKADPPSPLTREALQGDEWGVAWVSWAPQTAILAHPLTRAFVSHGGQESVYEAMYWGTPLLVLPSFVDQFTNGEKAKAAGLGLTLDKHTFTADEVYHKLRKLIQDEDGSVTAASDQLQRLIRLAAVDKDKAGASAIESQLLVGHRHLLTLPQREAWWWVYNWDVYGVALLCAVLLLRIAMLLLVKCVGGATGGRKERVKAA